MTTSTVGPDVVPAITDDDDDDYRHIANAEDAMKAAIEGIPIRALCGKVIPGYRDPSGRDTCPMCAELAGLMLASDMADRIVG